MTSHLVPSDTVKVYRIVAEQSAGVALLPESQQLLVAWLNQREFASLEEIATHFGQAEETLAATLDRLIEQGLIETIETAATGPSAIAHARHEGMIISPLAVIVSPSSHYSTAAGTLFELSVTVFNRGRHHALIDIFIDETAQTVRQWCLSPSERLALGAGESNEVTFQFHIPVQTLPDTYTYQLVIDAPHHYPEDTPIQFTKTLQVLPSTGTISQINDPTFVLTPVTTSAHPAIAQPNGVLELRLEVYNRSNRVDQFYLGCSDLPKDWFTIRYPENLAGLGLITSNPGLRLNPNTKGEIFLTLTPPLDALAGRYSPTIQLISINHPELNLLDVIHFEVASICLLESELKTLVGKIRNLPGAYQIKLRNTGNTARTLTLDAHSLDEDEANLYDYSWDHSTSVVEILPKQTQTVGLKLTPRSGWKRPWRGKGRISQFEITLEDAHGLPLSGEPLQGTVVWQSRPLWQFLLLLLTMGGMIGTALVSLWIVFFKPNIAPEITAFNASDASYSEAKGDAVRLNWEISSSARIEKLQVLARAQGNLAVLSQPVIYDFSQGIPPELKPFCTIAAKLTCRNVPTDARKAGDYVFELQATLKGPQPAVVSKSTDTIQIQAIALPKIEEFSAAIARSNPIDNSFLITQQWKISQADQIGEIRLVGRSMDGSVTSPLLKFSFAQGIPRLLQPFCTLEQVLTCKNIALPVTKLGNQVFELMVIPKNATDPSDTKKTDTLTVEPAPPKILSFQINGQDAKPKYRFPIQSTLAPQEIAIAWQIESGAGIKAELLPTPGAVPLQGSMRYPMPSTPGSTTLTLQVTHPNGTTLKRAVELEFFDPNSPQPSTPALPAVELPTPTFGPPAPLLSRPSAAPLPTAPLSVPLPPPPPPLPIDPENPAPANVPPQFN